MVEQREGKGGNSVGFLRTHGRPSANHPKGVGSLTANLRFDFLPSTLSLAMRLALAKGMFVDVTQLKVGRASVRLSYRPRPPPSPGRGYAQASPRSQEEGRA